MIHTDFIHLNHFTASEIEKTGAFIEDVKYELMYNTNRLRELIGKPIILLPNGLTTGKHKSEYHIIGEAVDFYIEDLTDKEAVMVCFLASAIGFRGIGVYKNKKGVYSFHMDLRSKFGIWKGIKNKSNTWKYKDLTFDME